MPPGTSSYVHCLAVQSEPLYVTSSPATYATLFTHAATPEQDVPTDVVVAAGAVVVDVTVIVAFVVVVAAVVPQGPYCDLCQDMDDCYSCCD